MRNIILTLESINLFVWIVVLLFSVLFLDSPGSRFSHLALLYIPLLISLGILLLSIFIFKTTALLIVGFVLTCFLSVPVVFYVAKKNSPSSTISDRKRFILPDGYVSIAEYLQKNENKEIRVNGKLFIHNPESDIEFGSIQNGKLFITRAHSGEVVVVELPSVDAKWGGEEIIVEGVLLKKDSGWFMKDFKIFNYK